MIFTPLELSGAFAIDVDPRRDERGLFARTYCDEEFRAHGIDAPFRQCSVSFNERRGTLRGMHFQAQPHAEDKLVRCTAGAVFDVIVDLRAGSPTLRRWSGTELSAANRRALFVPRGFAHGFLSLTDGAEVLYMISVPHAAHFSRGFKWDDPAVGIDWPFAPAVIGDRDARLPSLADG
ncbi:MAG TPA: dTDP-4-dehydrorhamnose 3,5-epimerase [Steroidobacteraceae bacterium]|nr:dTDP-4-dehydrorhamnose 3,5-epimerase [Steroidobacteraceae bacterium]